MHGRASRALAGRARLARRLCRAATRAAARLRLRRGAGLQGGRCPGLRSEGPRRRVPPDLPAALLRVRYLRAPHPPRRRSPAWSLTPSASRPLAKPHGRRRGSVTRSFPGSRRREASRQPPQLRAAWCRKTVRRRHRARCRMTARRRHRARGRKTPGSLSKARCRMGARGSRGGPAPVPEVAGMRRIGALRPGAATRPAVPVTGPTFHQRARVASRRSGSLRPNPGSARRPQATGISRPPRLPQPVFLRTGRPPPRPSGQCRRTGRPPMRHSDGFQRTRRPPPRHLGRQPLRLLRRRAPAQRQAS
jgi:hypothetical protein